MATKTFCDYCGGEIEPTEQRFTVTAASQSAFPSGELRGGYRPRLEDVHQKCIERMFTLPPRFDRKEAK